MCTRVSNIFLRLRINGSRMNRRLILYFLFLLTVLTFVVYVFISVFGLFVNVESEVHSALNNYLDEYSSRVLAHYDSVAAQSVKFSKNLSGVFERSLAESGFTFPDLLDNPQLIADLESRAYDTTIQALYQTKASGVFFMLDTTANTRVENAERNKSGLYIKIVNINATDPMNPDVLLFRGAAETARRNEIIYHNQWNMEFDSNNVPFFGLFKESLGRDLTKNWYASPLIDLPHTWDDAAFVAVPIYGSDGMFYGICGFEINLIYYMHMHMLSSSEFRNISGLLAIRDEDGFRAGSGLRSGTYGGGYATNTTTNMQPVRQKGALTVYSDGQELFIGMEKTVTLSPLDGENRWGILIMIPKSDYDEMEGRHQMSLVLLLILIVTVSVLSAVLMSRRYVRPIKEGLDMIKQGRFKRSSLPEINDLLDFLSEQDAKRESAGLSIEMVSPLVASYMDFSRRLEDLTPAESDIFDLYMQDKTAQQIAEIQHISINTVKFHNKNIYAKLGVSSRNELMLLTRMTQGTGTVQ